MFSPPRHLRLSAFLLAVVFVWWLIGSPVTAEEWAALPAQGQMALRQLPVRARRLINGWLPALEKTETVSVYDADASSIAAMPLQEYLLGAVAAEMPASYHLEALKAQAVAARTRLYAPGVCATRPEARVCTQSACCQGYLSPEGRAARWGADQDAYEARLLTALQETDGLILTYEGEPVTMLYHAVSGGRTEDAGQVFSQSLPYLVSVDSPGEEGSAKYETRTRWSLREAAEKLNAAFPDAHIDPQSIAEKLTVKEASPTGRALTLQVGDSEVSGRHFRQALGLNSTWITLSVSNDTLTITQRGYGHGVGMSQAGANAMAARGSGMPDILAHYYPGCRLYETAAPGTP